MMKRLPLRSLILACCLAGISIPSLAGVTLGVHSGHGQLGYSIGYHTGYHHGIGLGYSHHFSHRPISRYRHSHDDDASFQHRPPYNPQPVYHRAPAQLPKRPMIRVTPFPPRH